jgi:hypothetical protein
VAFEVAIYTDVLAREAVDGVDGFNFQAVSPGLSGADQRRIRESLLHRIVPAWSLAHDELSHPPTCAYVVAGGRSYLARGTSTGTTNSGRPGNQLTQAIVTSDPDDFVPYRPAQLYGALEWSLRKAPGSRLDPWVTPLEIRPEFEAAALLEYVRADAWAAAVLPQFLTMLDEALATPPKKLVLLHTDLDVVMRWIALGTLFVDAETAQALQFRALVDDPWRASATIVGVSPQFTAGGLGAANVLDLDRRLVPTITPSDVAKVRAASVLRHGVDALNALAIARRWEPTLGPVLATEAARLVGLPAEASAGRAGWHTAMAVVDQLAQAGLSDDLALYSDELCDAAFGYGPASPDEFQLAGTAIRRAHDLGVDEVASGVALGVLEALAAVPAASDGFARELAGAERPITWESAEARAAAGRFLVEVLLRAPGAALPDLFAAARVLGAAVPEERLRPAVDALAALWLRDLALGAASWPRWLAGRSVAAATGRLVVDACRSGDRQTLSCLRRGEWDFLTAITDDPALAGWLQAGQLGRIPVRERAERVAAAEPVPPGAWRIVLAGSALPTHARLWASWIDRHGLADSLAAEIRLQLDRARGAAPTDAKRPRPGDWAPLMTSLRTATNPELARDAAAFAQARAALRKAKEDVSARPGARLDKYLPSVPAFAPLLLVDIGWLLVNSRSADEVDKLLAAAAPWGSESVRAWILWLAAQSGRGLSAVEWALNVRRDAHDELATAAEDALDQILTAHPELADQARRTPRLRDDMDDYQPRRAGALGTVRRGIGSMLGRGKEKEK